MQFVKMHGIGNDFVMVDARGEEQPWAELAVQMCDRHMGIGADGLILLLPSDGADLLMRMFNPDGSESEMCGNGIRCFAKYALEEGIAAAGASDLTVETLAGLRSIRPVLSNGKVDAVRVGMGAPRFRAAEIPVAVEGDDEVRGLPLTVDGVDLAVSCASMGNPHAVHFLSEPVAGFPLDRIGPQVEHHPLFPARINFEIVNVIDRGHLDVRVWERGAGLTLACGTGAC
ncbi:MAG: diaminopimelate epimerase, partial [Chloroflexi bacterium]|nr:diaminopimelate epimerase [Chloroflexota bacterium]